MPPMLAPVTLKCFTVATLIVPSSVPTCSPLGYTSKDSGAPCTSLSISVSSLVRAPACAKMTVMASSGLNNHGVCLREIYPKGLVLEVQVWSTMPGDLEERILRWLPLASKLRFKSVCKHWNSLLSSDSVLNYRTNAQDRKSSFLLCTTGAFACSLDPFTNSWQKLFKPASPGSSVVAAGGSLLCLGNQVAECRVLSVFNPLTKVSKVLPKMPRVGLIHKVSMAIDEITNAYLIVVTGEDGADFRGRHVYRLLTEVYDSLSGSWRTAGDALPDAKFGSDPGVWCNGLFYCITELPYGVTAFDVGSGSWIDLQAQMPECIASPSLVSCRGQLLMVGREVDSNSSSRCVKVWRLCQGKTWQVFEQMPEEFCTAFLSPSASLSPLVCAGVGDMVCITTHLSPRTAVCDIMSKSWRWMIPDPLFPNNRDSHLLGFSFQPRLDSIP